MQTLSCQFPLVAQVSRGADEDAAALAAPYLKWYLIAFDGEFNLLLSRYSGDLRDTPLAELVILVGPVATAWIQGVSQ